MKQLLQHARTGEISVSEVPVPQLLPGCVLVQVAASLVSAGTERASAEFARKTLLEKAKARPDLIREVIGKVQRDGVLSAIHAVRGRLDEPQLPGYSSAGSIVAVGEGVTDLRPGDRVACAGAGFAVHAEVACVPRLLVARIPERTSAHEVAFDEAAFATLGAVALHAIRTAEVKLGDLVAVIGLGLLGQLAAQLLKAAGCRVLGMDIDRWRAQLAKQLGANAVASNASEFKALCLEYSQGTGVDSVLIAAETGSSEPVNLAGVIARDRAIVVAAGTVGIDIERKPYYTKELDFRISRSYGPGRYDATYEQKGRDYPIGYVRWTETRNMDAFLQLLAEGKIDVAALITHRFAIERSAAAYDLITGKSREPFLGIVIQYSGTVEFSRTLQLVRTPIPFAARRATVPVGEVWVGMLGAGTFASGILLPAIKRSEKTSLVGVCAATGAHAQRVAKKFGFLFCTTDEAQVIDDDRINAIVIATRHHLHARQVLSALKKGRHVFCEKPLCLTEDELRSIVRAYPEDTTTPRPVLTVGFNRRFAPMTQEVKSFLGSISEPLAIHYRINAGHLPADHWTNDREQGGGRILGEVCHFVDLMMYLASSPVVEVEAHTLGRGRYSGDNVIASIRFANGSEGTIAYLANGDRCFSKERVEIFGGGAVAVLDDFRLLELSRDGRRQTIHSRWRQNKGHREEWVAFQQAVCGKREAVIDFQEIVCSALATMRIQESVATGRRLSVNSAEFIDTALQSSSPMNDGLALEREEPIN